MPLLSRFLPCLALALLILFVHPHGLPAAEDMAAETGPLRAASEFDYPPFCIVGPEGTADGFSVDLLKAVVNVMGREISFAVGPWHELKENLAAGRLDVLPLVSYTRERDEIYDFTVPYLIMHGEIFVRQEDKKNITNLADLKGKKVMVMQGDTAHEWALGQGLDSDLILTTTFSEAFQLLASGRHDAVLAQKVMGLQLIRDLGLAGIVTVGDPRKDVVDLKPTRITTPGFEQKFCFAVQEGDKVLLGRLNEALAVLVANGTYDRLYQKWFEPILPPRPVPLALQIKNTLLTLAPILFVLVLAWLVVLKREVARKTLILRREILGHQKAEEQKTAVIAELQQALAEIKTLQGILPLCSFCKKIRNDQGDWEQVDVYIHKNAQAQISHSVCPDCMARHYPADQRQITPEKPPSKAP